MAALAAAFAKLNDEVHVDLVVKWLKDKAYPDLPEVLEQVVLGFLGCNNIDAVLMHLKKVVNPSSGDLVSAVAKGLADKVIVRSDKDTSCELTSLSFFSKLLRMMESASCLPVEALLPILTSSAHCGNTVLVARAEQHLRSQLGAALPLSAFIALIQAELRWQKLEDSRRIELFDQMVEAHPGVDASTLLLLISACGIAQDPDLAVRVYSWTRSSGLCTSLLFSATVKSLAISDEASKICDVCKTALDDGMEMESSLSGQLVRFACQAHRIDIAQQLYETAPCTQTATLICLIRALAAYSSPEQLEHAQTLHKLWDDILNRDRPVESMLGNTLLQALFNLKDTKKICEVFEKMRELECADAVSHSIVFKSRAYLDRPGGLALQEKLLEELVQRGSAPQQGSVPPGGHSAQNALLQGAVHCGNFEQAQNIIARMESHGLPIDGHTVAILFKGYKHFKSKITGSDFDAHLNLLSKCSSTLEEQAACAALEACLRLRDVTRLKRLLVTLKQMGWTISAQCSPATHALMIKACSEIGDFTKANQIWEKFVQEGTEPPSDSMYAQMIDALVTVDKLDRALFLFCEMKEIHLNISSGAFTMAYAMIIKGFAQQRDSIRALLCYKEMKTLGVHVGMVVLNTLIDACFLDGDVASASRIFGDISKEAGSEYQPDIITYSTMVKGYCLNGMLDEAMEVFQTMRSKGIQPDAILFNSLLLGCAKARMHTLCTQILEDMLAVGVKPGNHSASILIKLYGKEGDLDGAFQLFNEMPKKFNFKPNIHVYTTLMVSCIWKGRVDLAMDLRLRFIEAGFTPDSKMYATLMKGALRGSDTSYLVMLLREAMEQLGGKCRPVIDEGLVADALAVICKKHTWEKEGGGELEELIALLRENGYRCAYQSSEGAKDSGLNKRYYKVSGFTSKDYENTGVTNKDSKKPYY
eukprot:TRINITY_DN11296_c0_g2_i1.p1 TRINITY_DN11296_c0_g2~~TRINITY_DN11296_c0_g2_i1.p1  ORF type:complete len:954 (+),score=192.40 TRINITY_DN11296_c0_g2_i1:77-2863(+)